MANHAVVEATECNIYFHMFFFTDEDPGLGRNV